MAERRRTVPGLFTLLGIGLLIGPIAFAGWWFTRPAPDGPPPGPPLDELDVVCAGRVDAAGGVFSLEPSVAGRVKAVAVKEGQPVKKGDEILRLEDADYRIALEEANAAVRAAEAGVLSAKKEAEAFPTQIAIREKTREAAGEQVKAARNRVEELKRQLPFAPSANAASLKSDLDAAESRLRQAEISEDAERTYIAHLKTLDPQLAVRAADARRDAAEAARKRAEKAVRDCVLVAPSAGTVLRLQAAVGGVVAPGSPAPAVVFAPAGPLVVRAEIEQANLGRVTAGMPAVVRDDSRPDGPTWSGRVLRVGDWIAQKRAVLFEPGELNDVRTAECIVSVEPGGEPLRIGQRMQVRIPRAGGGVD